jgi:hypothetical protein
MQYLSQAGGWTNNAHVKFVTLIRHPNDLSQPCTESDLCILDMRKIYKEPESIQYFVQPGDVIYVPPKGERITLSTVTTALNTAFLGVNFFENLNDNASNPPDEPEGESGDPNLLQ